MNKLTKSIIFVIFIMVITMFGVSTSYAVDVFIRIEEPKTPTNDNDFNITFVALDIQNRPITVSCFKKGPSDADFSQFGSDLNLSAGGNSSSCNVDSNLMNQTGTYQFYAVANAGGDSSTSTTATVVYKTGTPATPYNFSKEKISSCEYKIKFKTGADNGLTKKVEIYMSSLKSFSADSGTKVGEVGIGSDLDGSFTKVLSSSDCDKTFYFVIRAFDDAGNGSGTTGDSETTVITSQPTTTTTTTQTQGAILAESPQVAIGEVLGESKSDATAEGEILGTESTPGGAKPQASNLFSFKNIVIFLLAALAIGGVYCYRKFKS